jgi:5-formyltetrahydrofolate cyclo-ligase
MESTTAESDKAIIRKRVWAELREVALPDSRFHWNFAEFIPDLGQ